MSSEATIYIAGFAALISTITLIWNIFNALLSRVARIRVEFTTAQQMISHPLTGLGDPIAVFSITVTNVGSGTRFVKNPAFLFDRGKKSIGKMERRFQSIDVQNPTKFPVELQVGRDFTSSVGIEGFVRNFNGQLSSNEKVRIEVEDTHGKKFRSRKLSMKGILNALEVSGHFRT